MSHPKVNIHTHLSSGNGIRLVNYSIGRDPQPSWAQEVSPAGEPHGWGDIPCPGEAPHNGVTVTGQGETCVKCLLSAAIHPWDAQTVPFAAHEPYLMTAPLAAIGETGLDYSTAVDRDAQLGLFESQLEVAAQRDLPVIIHCVKAYGELVRVLDRYRLRAVILHSYTGSPQQTRELAAKGYYFSYSPRSLGSPKTVESLKVIPPQRLFAETDQSQESICGVYGRLCRELNLEEPLLDSILYDNYKRIFK